MELNFTYYTTEKSLLIEESLPIDKESVWFNNETETKEISIEELRTILETNNLLNYPNEFLSLDNSNQTIPSIIKINLVDNINIKNSENIFEHYNRDTGEITITEKLLFNEQLLPNTFPEHLFASVGQSKLLMFAILHEVGHAIHHQLFLRQNNNSLIPGNDFNNNDFLNLVSNNGLYLLGKNEETKKYDLNHSINYAIKEGFADLYACIGLTQIYPKEVALNFINEVIQARKVGNDNYFTTGSLEQFKEDFTNNKITLNNFEDLHQYIDKTISKTAIKTMLGKLSSTNEEQIRHNNAFGGFLKSIIEKSHEQGLFSENPLENSKTINEVIKSLELNNNEFHIDLNELKENSEIFNKSYNITNQSIADVKESNFLSCKLFKIVSEKPTEKEQKIGLIDYQEKSHFDIKSRMQSIRNNALNNNKNQINCHL